MTTTDRLVDALHPRNPETAALLAKVVRHLAAQLDADQFDQITDAVEHPTGISTDDLAHQAQVTRRQVDYWTTAGWLTPQPGPGGQGYHRRYNTDQIAKATVMGRLVRLLGMDPTHASYAAEELLAKGHARVPGLELTRRGTR